MSPISPRRRRIRNTLTVLSALALIGLAVGAGLYLKRRPSQYRPDELSTDITSELARTIPSEAPRPAFANVTASAGLAEFRNFAGDRTSQLPEDVGPGVAWADFNNDGLEDVFLVSAGGPLGTPTEKLLPCALYQNIGNGKFRKVETFPETRIRGMAATWGDYNDDGFLDLLVTGYNTLLLFRNESGSGNFSRDSRIPDAPGFWSGAAWGDYDNDRRLDLYVCGYVQYQEETGIAKVASTDQSRGAIPFTLNPASYLGGTNLLFHQNADGTFTEVSAVLNVQNVAGRSLGALWHDFDDDGWLDLYVANDISDNVLFHNERGAFKDISHPALVADYRSAMGLAAGDFDRDGDDDLYVTHWTAQENALYQNLWADFNAKTTNCASTNALRPLSFMDIADAKGLGQIALQYVGWGCEFADFDSDGWLDLAAVNGNTLEFEGPLPRQLKPQESFLFWNRRGEFFHNLAPLSPALSEQHNSRGLALADYDNDGKLDILIADLGEGVRLLRNEMRSGNYLKIRFRSRNAAGHPTGFGNGSKAIAHIRDVALRRTVSSVSYLSQSSHTLHFGLGAATRVTNLEVRWHAGETQHFPDLDANATYEIIEGETAPRRIVTASASQTSSPSRQQQIEFWKVQRAAMDAMKTENDRAKAITLFRQALAIDSHHEDSLYYLGLCLAEAGETEAALAQLDQLRTVNPSSHRAWQQWGVIRASTSRRAADLKSAQSALERAHALNPEETGALLALGEVLLMRGDLTTAEQQLTRACMTNPRAINGQFLRGYLAWKRNDSEGAKAFLEKTRAALGPDWQPKGSTSEGDVKRKHHINASPLARFAENWNGINDPATAFAALDTFLNPTDRRIRVLVYQKNGKGYVHDNLAASAAAIRELGSRHGFEADVSTNAAVFLDPALANYRAIIFANSNNEAFDNDDQRAAFQLYIENGGGFVGIHSSTGSERKWSFFQQVQGARFLRHPPMQTFTIKALNRAHPATSHLPETWPWTDECYFFTNASPKIQVLLAADVTTVKDAKLNSAPGQQINGVFPLCWQQQLHGGRQFYTALGHKIEHYSDPIFRQHLLGGIQWVLDATKPKSE
jgi:type 1 glutamine amidotransferase/Tfp pilus assembly protein PilF